MTWSVLAGLLTREEVKMKIIKSKKLGRNKVINTTFKMAPNICYDSYKKHVFYMRVIT